MPVFFATTIVMPVSRKGTVKSTYACLSELILIEVTTISARELSNSATKPFHVPFCKVNRGKIYYLSLCKSRDARVIHSRREKVSIIVQLDR